MTHPPTNPRFTLPPIARLPADLNPYVPRPDALAPEVETLAQLRTAYWLGGSAVHLHALTSLIAQAQQLLPRAVHDARDQELTWAQIGELLNTTAATAGRRYRGKP